MKKQDFDKLEQMLDEMFKIDNILDIPTLQMQDYECVMYKVASENPNDSEMLEFGIRMLHKIYNAKITIYYSWIDTLEKETYRALEEYVFNSKNA